MLTLKKIYFSLLAGSLLFSLPLLAMDHESEELKENQYAHSAYIAKQDGKVIETIGKCDDRHSPFSTFKVPLALMGFDAEVLNDKDSPKWSFKEEYEKNFQGGYTHEQGLELHWCQEHIPATFMKYSVVWFSHQITQKLGRAKFQNYVTTLSYGNRDISGTPGKDDGLLNSWLGTSLEISPREQVEFLEKLCANELNLSKDAQEKTRKIMDREEKWEGWKLYGKTGGGGSGKGWFIGWIEKDQDRIIFAQYLDLEDQNLDLTGIPSYASTGLIAKEVIKKNILRFFEK